MKKFVLFLCVVIVFITTGILNAEENEELPWIEDESTETEPIEKKPIETEPIETEPIEKKPIEKNPIETKPVKTELRVYTVWIWQETGDCLWNIAKKYYGDPYKWRIIYEANMFIIDDPNIIYPKQKLIIPFLVDEEIAE